MFYVGDFVDLLSRMSFAQSPELALWLTHFGFSYIRGLRTETHALPHR